LIDRIDEGECVFVTDDWAGFYRLLPEDRHFPGKDVTFPLNSDIHHRLARFIPRTQASSRSVQMVHARLKLTPHLQDDSVLLSYLNPLVSILS
jgi:IS1 family transposase